MPDCYIMSSASARLAHRSSASSWWSTTEATESSISTAYLLTSQDQDPGFFHDFTGRGVTYGHLFADTEDLGRTAIDRVLRPVLTEPERNWSLHDYKAAGQSAGSGRAGL